MGKILARTAAIMLLLLVCVDLGIPSLCAAESIPLLPPVETGDSQPIPPSPAGPVSPVLGEGDCFCCSTHVVSQSPVRVVESLLTLADEPPAIVQPVPFLIPQTIFHPPKA